MPPAVVEKLWRGAVEMGTAKGSPRGCLVVNAALACGDAADPVRRELIQMRKLAEKAIRDRFKRAKADGDLPKDAHPADLARYTAAVLFGLEVQAASGATRAELRRAVDVALRGWRG
jgi:AcrR family transcriptional regulator